MGLYDGDTQESYDSDAMSQNAGSSVFRKCCSVRYVETLAGKSFHSKLHNTIQYIHNETMGRPGSYDLDAMV
eukprot:scaffold9399_cov65-Cyclotella_meneghiniana.AAC.1